MVNFSFSFFFFLIQIFFLVPSLMRLTQLEAKSNESKLMNVETEDGEGGWIATHIDGKIIKLFLFWYQ